MPYFLGSLETIAYPKNRIRLWFVTDHNNDESLEFLKSWRNAWELEYDQIVLEVRDPRKGHYDDANTELSWSRKRYEHTLKVTYYNKINPLLFLLSFFIVETGGNRTSTKNVGRLFILRGC